MSDAVTRARELLAAATPGPWEAATCHESEQETRSEYVRKALLEPDAPAHGLWMTWKPDSPLGVHLTAVTGDGPHGEADAELIAAAPTLLAELADEVERLTPVCSGCRYEPEAECPVHGYSRAELWAEVERLTSENGDLFDYACMCVGGEWDLTCPVHTDGEDVVSASERISALADEVERLRARLDAVLAIHSDRNGDCAECEMSTGQGVDWPCWTYEAALGVES